MNKSKIGGASVSSINDYVESSQDEDPLMKEIRLKLQNIQARYPSAEESQQQSLQQSQKSNQKSFQIQKGKQSVKFNDSENQAYSLNKSSSTKQKEFIKKMENKLSKELQTQQDGKKKGIIPKKQKNEQDHGKMVLEILKQHEIKLQKYQKKEDELFIEEAIGKMKPKKINQKLYIEKREKGWGGEQRRPLTAGQKEEKIDNKKVADDIAKQVKTQIQEARVPQKEKDFKVPVGEGVKTEKQKQEELKQKLELQKNTELNLLKQKIDQQEKKIEIQKAGKEAAKQQKEKEKKQIEEQKQYQIRMLKLGNQMTKENQDQKKKPNKALEGIQDILDPNKTDKKQQREEQQQIKDLQRVMERNDLDQEEINQLKVELRQLLIEQKNLKQTFFTIEEKRKDMHSEIKKMEKDNNVIILGEGMYAGLNTIYLKKDQSSAIEGENILEGEGLDNFDDQGAIDFTNETTAERIVRKIEENGLTIQKVYLLLDNDGDGVLTRQEIDDNLTKIGLDITQEEALELVNIIDKNGDGVVNEFEFIQAIESEIKKKKEYTDLMGNLGNILPIELEERKLDLEIRRKIVQKKIVYEEQKSMKKKQTYDQVLIQLKKEEELFLKRESLRKKPKQSEILKKINDLKRELRLKEDDREKQQTTLKERLQEIDSNINELTSRLMMLSEQVIQAKNIASNAKDHFEKLTLKEIAFDKVKQRIEDDAKLREQELRQYQAMKEKNLLIKHKQVKETKTNLLSFYQIVGAVMLLQKIFRGWKMRTNVRKHKQTLKKSVLIIGRNYTLKKKVTRIKEMMNVLMKKYNDMQEEGIISLKSEYYNKLNYDSYRKTGQYMFNLKKQKIILIRGEEDVVHENLMKRKIFDDEQELANIQTQDKTGKEKTSSFVQIQNKGVQKTKKIIKFEPYQKIFSKEIYKQKELASTIIIQRFYCARLLRLNPEKQISNGKIYVPGEVPLACKICGIKEYDFMCRQCELQFQCEICYQQNHKNYKRKNHTYFIVRNKDKYDEKFFSTAEQAKKSKQIVLQTFGDRMEELEKKIDHTDQYNYKTIKLDVFMKTVKEIFKIQLKQKDNPLVILETLLREQYLKNPDGKDEYLKELKVQMEIKGDLKSFKQNAKYVDYPQFFDEFKYLNKKYQDEKLQNEKKK